MKEWVKKEEGVSFGETSEQQPTGYAAHSDHNSRCSPCVGEGVLLVVAQVLAGKAQQQEGGTRQGTEREAQRHLAHDGSLCHSQCVAAHGGNSVGDDRHNTVVVGVWVKQQAQRNAEQADDGGNEGAHAGGDDGDQSVGHGSQHTGIFDHTGECACGKDDGDHQECGLCVTVDDLVLQIHTGVVDDEQDAVADHKGDSRAEAVGNEDVQDDQDQCHIEVPAPAGAGQFVGGVGGLCFGQTSDLLRGDACSNALGFLFAQESRDEQTGHQACDPGGHDAHPYLDSVEVTLVTESSTANTAFQANEYDMYWVGLANPTILQQLDGAGIYVKEDNQNGMGVESLGLIPNSAIDGPWADARVRRALCYALDVDAINAAFLMGMAQMTDQWAVPGSATYNDSLNHFTYDPEKAKSLLAEAGYADGFTTNIITISGMSDMLTAIANMLDEVGIHCNIQQVDSATNNQYMKDGTWEGLMLHFATIAPDLGLYMGRHLDKNGAYYAKGIQHPDKEMELLEEIRRCMDPDEKHKLEKELQAAIYDAEDGSCLFGRVLYVNKSSMYKYDYVIDDHATEAFTACWDLSACWLNK
mgnify:CR=1 FL=1